MATINERLEALESLLESSNTLKERVEALEEKLKTSDESLTEGEKQFQFLKELPDGRCKNIDESTQGITGALNQFTESMKEMSDPFQEKVTDLTNRIKAMELQIGISN